MSSIIIFAKEVARFGDISYSFEVESDANRVYCSCNLKKKNGDAITGSITIPFEVMEKLQVGISSASEYLSHDENWLSLLPISKAEHLQSIIKKSVHLNGLRMFCIASLVRVEEHYFYIGVIDSGPPEGPDYNMKKYFYCVLETMEQFAIATKEAIAVVDKFDLNQGSVRRRIELKTPSDDKLNKSPIVNTLLRELPPLNPTKTD